MHQGQHPVVILYNRFARCHTERNCVDGTWNPSVLLFTSICEPTVISKSQVEILKAQLIQLLHSHQEDKPILPLISAGATVRHVPGGT